MSGTEITAALTGQVLTYENATQRNSSHRGARYMMPASQGGAVGRCAAISMVRFGRRPNPGMVTTGPAPGRWFSFWMDSAMSAKGVLLSRSSAQMGTVGTFNLQHPFTFQ